MAEWGNYKLKPTRRLKIRGCSEDRISQLPDDVLVALLSYLTMKEAARTSVLSKRWRYLWTYFPYLDFDGQKELDLLQLNNDRYKLINERRSKYVNWVNQVIKSRNTQNLEVIRFRFDLDSSFASEVDGWLHFAMERKVRVFELDLSQMDSPVQENPYSFPPLLGRSIGFSSCCSSLKVLKFKIVNLTGEILESFLTNCPFLERLHVFGTDTLENLRVAGSSLKLRHLELNAFLKSLQVSAPNLVSFNYFGPVISMPLEHTPKLVETSFGGEYGEHMLFNLSKLSTYLSQLQRLTLNIDLYRLINMNRLTIPVLENLKEFELIAYAEDRNSLLGFSSLMVEAFPCLQRFSLKLFQALGKRHRTARKGAKCRHEKLKVVELVGYVTRAIADEVALFFIENAVSLEKLILDPFDPYLDETTLLEKEVIDEMQAARIHAKKCFSHILPPGLQLIIL